jgi:hypothetical protein
MTALQGGACGITSAHSGLLANFRRQKMSHPVSESDRAVRPADVINDNEEFTDVENLPLPVVRQ